MTFAASSVPVGGALIRSTDAESRGGDEDVLRPSSEGGDGSRYGAGAGAE